MLECFFITMVLKYDLDKIKLTIRMDYATSNFYEKTYI